MSLRSEVIRIFNELVGAGKKITELPPATTPLAGTELLEIVQSGSNKRITASSLSSGGTGVQTIVAGTNVTVDSTDPQNPIVSASGGGGSGTVESVTGDGVNNADPDNPIISYPAPGDIGAATTGSVTTVANDLSSHIADATAAHAASAISNTPAGTIAATTVQDAINELDTEKASTSYADAKVADSLANGVTTIAPSQNIVYDTINSFDLNPQTATYTAVLGDEAKLVRMNVATPNNFEIPPNVFPVETRLQWTQIGDGVTTTTGGAGVTLIFAAGVAAAPGKNQPVEAYQESLNVWSVWNGTPPLATGDFTRTNGTYITVTITGTPTDALLKDVNIAVDLTGTVPESLGGTGKTSYAAGDILFASAANTLTARNVFNTTPTALLHFKAGTATASTAPLKFTAGTNLTTPEAGAVEFDGTNFFGTASTTRYTLMKALAGSAALNFGSGGAIATLATNTLTITVTGAADGDEVILGVPNASFTTGLIFTARVSAANTVSIQCYNSTAGGITPASGTFRVAVIKR